MPEPVSTLASGEIVGSCYKILGMAGAGGMGVVYRARDLRLERTVALKFLPPELNASETEKQRFLREARTASSLDHANIGVIHGIEETPDGRTFIVMAFYEGSSLAQELRNGPLPYRKAVEIAIEIARGLEEAHSRHIVHRDIKPSNVMLTSSGSVRIVDFGLAHVMSAQTASQTGITGTVSYMSPEQSLGKLVDPRTDIWALGVVLAEMVTGRNPFERGTIPATLMAILNEGPSSIDTLPMALQHVIYNALAKEPGSRYQSCSDLLADLKALLPELQEEPVPSQPGSRRVKATPAVRRAIEEAARPSWAAVPRRRRGWMPWAIAAIAVVLVAATTLLLVPSLRERIHDALFGSSQKHIAVLPFDNIGNNPENAALVEGLMDSLAAKLSNLELGNQSLWVVPTSEVRRRRITDPADALKDLGANLVVKGSVERDGKAVRLNINLIDTSHLRQIGSAEIEDQAGDLSTLENEAVSRLARLMNITVSAEMLRNTGGSVNPAAYEYYLTALGYMQRYDKPGNLDLAITDLQNSVKTDPRFALGYAQLGEAYRLKYRVDTNAKWLTEAEANCQKAAELDNRMAAVYVTLGKIHDTTGKRDLALQEFQHALDIDPRNSSALSGLAAAYERSGRIADADAAYQKAAALRPDDWDGHNNLGNFYERQNKFPQAIAQYQRALQLTPDNAQVLINLGGAYLESGDATSYPAAEQALKKSIELAPSYPAYTNLGNLYTVQQRYAESAAATEKALQLNDNDYLVWNNLLGDYRWLKDSAKAEAVRKRMLPMVEQAVRLKPQDAAAQSEFAVLHAMNKEKDRALEEVQTSVALAPDDPQILSNIADVYELLGDRGHAMEYLEKALQKGLTLDQARTDPDLQALLQDPKFHPGK
ncbi:MAG TPA: protein kinase [Acidisarcina sp.]|nr:protein kinase [Acidisarcina sp.]